MSNEFLDVKSSLLRNALFNFTSVLKHISLMQLARGREIEKEVKAEIKKREMGLDEERHEQKEYIQTVRDISTKTDRKAERTYSMKI